MPTLLSLLNNFISLPVNPPTSYLNLEGIKLSCDGSISTISLYIASTNKIYLIDIHRLRRTAFSTSNSSAPSLKSILESPIIPKVRSAAVESDFPPPVESLTAYDIPGL